MKGYMSPFPINGRKERIFDQKLQRKQNARAGLLVHVTMTDQLFFAPGEKEKAMHKRNIE